MSISYNVASRCSAHTATNDGALEVGAGRGALMTSVGWGGAGDFN
jgi:hypothetical protein